MPRTRPTARELVVDAPLEWVEERSGWVGLVEKFLFRNVPATPRGCRRSARPC